MQPAETKRPLHFLHIRKTAGTAIKYALEQHAAAGSYSIQLHPHRTRLKHVPVGEQVFFFLRDPVSRFVSGFYSRQRQGQPRYCSPWKDGEEAAFQEFLTPNELACALSSRDRSKTARARAAMNTIRHIRDSYWKWFHSDRYFRSRFGDVFFVGRQERLADDFEILKRRLRLPADLRLPDDRVYAHQSDKSVDRTLDKAAGRNLKDWYRDDYRFIALCEELIERQAQASLKRAG